MRLLWQGGNTASQAKGLWALGGPQDGPEHRVRVTISSKRGTSVGEPTAIERVYVSQHLSLIGCRKAITGKPRSEPDSGNPTVRDRLKACGNVSYGEG